MASKRLTDLTLAPGVTLSDLIHIVITGDTSQDPAGSSYKTSLQDVYNAFNIPTSFTGNTSGDCITDLYVSNINSCSPLHIQNFSSGDILIGENGGVDVAIGTDIANSRLEIKGSGSNASTFTLRTKNSNNTYSLQVSDDGSVFNYGKGSVTSNTAFGNGSLISNTSGYNNTSVGYHTLRLNTTGLDNTAMGYQSLMSNTTGTANTAFGDNTLSLNTTGNVNTALGSAALNLNTTGQGNTAVGRNALYSNTTGLGNVSIGTDSLIYNTTANYNVAIGVQALYSNVKGSGAVAIGNGAMRYSNDTTTPFTNTNIAIGYEALQGSITASTNTGLRNTAIGYQSLLSNTSGDNNNTFGYYTLKSNTTGFDNVAIGNNSMLNSTLGWENTAVGVNSLINSTTGSYNTAVGKSSMLSMQSGWFNTAIGYRSMPSNNVGGSNVAIGPESMSGNIGGSINVAIGANSLPASSSSNGNVAVGNLSLYDVTADNNVGIGRDSGSGLVNGSNNTFVGYSTTSSLTSVTNSTVIGAGATVGANNTMVFGNTSIVQNLFTGKIGVNDITPDSTITVKGAGNTSATTSLRIRNSSDTILLKVEDGGNVGIGTSSPSETLDVNGKTKTVNFQMTSGATNNYVLVSDSLGNGSWQNVSAATVGNLCYGAFYDTTTQTASTINTAYAMKLNSTQTSETNGVVINNNTGGTPTQITVSKSGIYDVQFSAQLYRVTGGTPKKVVIWLRKNGSDVPYSSTQVSLQANADYLVAAWNFFISLNVNDYMELMWSTEDTDIEIASEVAISPAPETPSLIVTINKIN